MNFFEQELRKLFVESNALRDIRFTGRVCLARLNDATNVKLEFVTLGHADHYEGIKATVLNRREGPGRLHRDALRRPPRQKGGSRQPQLYEWHRPARYKTQR